jgi:hypothetical protein
MSEVGHTLTSSIGEPVHTFAEIVRSRLGEAAEAAGIKDDLPADPSKLLPSSVIRMARRCGVSVSDILNDPLSVEGNS